MQKEIEIKFLTHIQYSTVLKSSNIEEQIWISPLTIYVFVNKVLSYSLFVGLIALFL